jgi:hypothetical protein
MSPTIVRGRPSYDGLKKPTGDIGTFRPQQVSPNNNTPRHPYNRFDGLDAKGIESWL